MIAWWWVPVAVAGMWLVVILIGVLTDRDLRDKLGYLAITIAAAPLLPIVALLVHLDIGAQSVSPAALARFAQHRSADRTKPAWMFFVFRRGVLIIRKWEIGDERPTVRLLPHTEWKGGSGDRIS